MKKIITAIDFPKINEELKKEKNFTIIGKDIQYREAILETLERVKDINVIILYEKILGRIKIEELLKRIKNINSSIDIIIFLEKEDTKKIKILQKLNIKKIYYKNELNIKSIIRIINNKKIENKEQKIKNKLYVKNIEKNNENFKKSKKTKVITIIGNDENKKNILINIFIKYLKEKNKKILIVDSNILNKKLLKMLNKKNKYYINKINKKIISQINEKNFKKTIIRLEYKIDKDVKYICNINNIIKNIECTKLKNKSLNDFIKKHIKNYDYIIINSNINNKKRFIEESKKIICFLENDYLKKYKIKEIIEKYKNYINIFEKEIYIITNHNNINFISFKILNEILKDDIKINLRNIKKEYKVVNIIKDKNRKLFNFLHFNF